MSFLAQLRRQEQRFRTPTVEVISVGADTTAPTKGTVVYDKVSWFRVGKYMIAHFDYNASTGGAAGSGNYYVYLPGGLAADLNLVDEQDNRAEGCVGWGAHSDGAGGLRIAFLTLRTTRTLRVRLNNSSSEGTWGSGFGGFTGSQQWAFNIIVPIQGWS